jgi:drug/metabolite transporter (DMT)-like permease
MAGEANNRGPILGGVALAALAAALFGATAPLLQTAARGLNAVTVAAFLYLGAGALALATRLGRRDQLAEAGLARADLTRVLLVAALGAVAGPALLVYGLARTDAVRASLWLTLEAPLTVLLAAIFFREHVSRRVWLAVALITVGATLLVYRGPGRGAPTPGDVFVVLACLAWALDNTLSRRLAERDPLAVVAAKGLLGGALSLAIAALAGWVTVPAASIARLLALGAVGYGLSLLLYLRAQRLVGTARTASVFATAPFLGVAVAVAGGTPWPGPAFAVAAALMAVGLYLHATERHDHPHTHGALDHEHAHVHDDGHHGHGHDPMPRGPHSHPHHHEPLTHAHSHSEDAHHHHRHEPS